MGKERWEVRIGGQRILGASNFQGATEAVKSDTFVTCQHGTFRPACSCTRSPRWGGLLKVAMIRYPGYPVGFPAPCYFNCPCGAAPKVRGIGEVVPCVCGAVYSPVGYLVNSSPASLSAAKET